jgi:maltooligosyltrehalose trehalohydrolase
MSFEVDLGAVYQGEGVCGFRVWAPFAKSMHVRIVSPEERLIPMDRDERGYFSVAAERVEPGSLYFFRLNEEIDRPDPASRFQPRGVHGPSQVLDQQFDWEDESWEGIPLREHIIYELHVGTFTPEGAFDAIIPRLDALRELGINNIEIMPVSQFPGGRNWGYDGVLPFATQSSYGGPEGFKRFINECHKRNMAVTLDVVYNHFGPEGNYLREFGPYFTAKYRTPWGDALNFDDEHNDEVRTFFIQNALYWLELFHIDALRLDAVHAIYDLSAVPFLRQLADSVETLWKKTGHRRYLIAESDLNDSRLIRPRDVWGYGLDAQWSDDFHHALHALLTGERQGYYTDFGGTEHLVKALNEGYVYSGRYSPYRKRSHGNYSADRPPEQFVVCTQNHDQVGNRMLGDRMSTLISFEARKLAAGALILSPYIPMLFMGEEYGEEAPFIYFVSHTDPELVEAVRKGRSEEFKEFKWLEEPPDPESAETFEKSKINWDKRTQGNQKTLLDFYSTLIRLRREIPAFSVLERDHLIAQGLEEEQIVILKRWWGESETLTFMNFSSEDVTFKLPEIGLKGSFHRMLDSADTEWGGPGSLLPVKLEEGESLSIRGHSVAVFAKK